MRLKCSKATVNLCARTEVRECERGEALVNPPELWAAMQPCERRQSILEAFSHVLQ